MYKSGKRNGFSSAGKVTGSLDKFGIENSVEHYLGHYRLVQSLEEAFNLFLDDGLKGKVSIANYVSGKLVLFCNDATSASILRYTTMDYIDKLKQNKLFEDIEAIKIRVKIKNT